MSIIIDGTNGISDIDGTASTPAIRGTDANTGIFFPAADTIAFAEGGSEVARFDSGGNFGLGVTPSAWSTTVPVLQIGGGGTFLAGLGSSPYLALGTNAHYNGTNFIYRTTNTASYYDQSSGLHRWYSAASGTAGNTITFTTILQANRGQTLALEGASLQNGTGITFPATQSASSDANTLDDYEEGAFTPKINGSSSAGTGTYTYQVGRYQKVGKFVTVEIYLSWTAHTGTGNMIVTDLPFQAANVTGVYSGAAIGYCHNITLSTNHIMTAFIDGNSTNMLCYQYPAGGGASSQVAIDTAGGFVVSSTYETTS